jgi:hypothetical protein
MATNPQAVMVTAKVQYATDPKPIIRKRTNGSKGTLIPDVSWM